VIQEAGCLFGYLYCLHAVLFRWRALRARYGSLDLFNWMVTTALLWWFAAYLIELGIWTVQYLEYTTSR
jgi:hypothetical protein